MWQGAPHGSPVDSGGPPARSGAARALSLVTRIHDDEVPSALLLFASVFLILTAYYLIKPAREGWLAVSVIAGLSKIEVKAYASFGQVLLLLGVVRLYARLVSVWPRGALVARVTIFLAANLGVFWLLQPGLLVERVPYLGVAFYLWVGIFNVFIVAQFWAYAADFYVDERGRRLMPLVALGATAGAVFGAWFAEQLVKGAGLRSFHLMLCAVAPLLASLVLLEWAERRGPVGRGLEARPEPVPAAGEAQDRGAGPFALIRRYPLLSATALLTLVYGWVGANGENVLFAALQMAIELEAQEQGMTSPAAIEAFTLESTTGFYGNFYFWVNLCSFLLQGLVVSRLLRFGGFAAVFLLLPLVSVLGYLSMALVPALGLIKAAKVAENATNYSVHNTARGVLWLPTTAEMKFKAKQAIDTLFVRLGDGLAALTVLIGVNLLAVSPLRIFWLNVALGVVWLGLGIRVVREHRRMREQQA